VGVGHHRCGPHCPRPSRQTRLQCCFSSVPARIR